MFNLTKSEHQICNSFYELKINSTELSPAQQSGQFKTL